MIKNVKINAERLRTTLRKQNVSGLQLCQSIGIKEGQIYTAYRVGTINLNTLELISTKLGKPIEYFLENKKNKIDDIDQRNSTPYNPRLYKKVLNMLEQVIDEDEITISQEVFQKLHNEIYAMVADKEEVKKDFIRGVVESFVKYIF